jgi:hypothetical protein
MNTRYLLKLWVSVILVTPALFILGILLYGRDPGIHLPYLPLYMVAVLMGALLGGLTFILFFFISYPVEARIKDPAVLKLFYVAVSLIGMIITMKIVGVENTKDFEFGGVSLEIWYAITIIVFGLIYKLKKIPTVLEKKDNVKP